MGNITYYSTNDKSERVNFETALMNGLGSQYGLYMISKGDIPKLEFSEIRDMADRSYAQIAFQVLSPFLKEDKVY